MTLLFAYCDRFSKFGQIPYEKKKFIKKTFFYWHVAILGGLLQKDAMKFDNPSLTLTQLLLPAIKNSSFKATDHQGWLQAKKKKNVIDFFHCIPYHHIGSESMKSVKFSDLKSECTFKGHI